MLGPQLRAPWVGRRYSQLPGTFPALWLGTFKQISFLVTTIFVFQERKYWQYFKAHLLTLLAYFVTWSNSLKKLAYLTTWGNFKNITKCIHDFQTFRSFVVPWVRENLLPVPVAGSQFLGCSV